ncbi:hypothetical protein ACIBI4_08690 [Streptomyces sp. NPDC050418]|uniref:hypothetical protein n=1 Tax=Streptomyces sp. NPDC050418 TaxID=3365612 RepID=UPI0037BA44D5
MPLPPPPPPTHLATWPDRAALLHDRGQALELLRRRNLGLGRLVLLWLTGLLAVFGWAMVAMPLMLIRDKDPMFFVLGPLCVILGLAALVPAVLIMVRGARTDRRVRELTTAWLALDEERASAHALRAPWRSLAWLLLSFVPCAGGLWAAFGGAHAAHHAYEAALALGSGMGLWVTGLLGVAKAVGHYQWAIRALGPPGNSRASLPVH